MLRVAVENQDKSIRSKRQISRLIRLDETLVVGCANIGAERTWQDFCFVELEALKLKPINVQANKTYQRSNFQSESYAITIPVKCLENLRKLS